MWSMKPKRNVRIHKLEGAYAYACTYMYIHSIHIYIYVYVHLSLSLSLLFPVLVASSVLFRALNRTL